MSTLRRDRTKAIVAATDLSPAADLAVEQAANLARRSGARLWLLHVFNDSVWAALRGIYDSQRWAGDEPALSARNRLSRLAGELARQHGIEVAGDTRTGQAAVEIARFADEKDADLVVLGDHGEDWIGDTFVGGTALKVLEQAVIPVLLARGNALPDYSRVMVACDFSENARRAAQAALDLFPEATHFLTHAYFVAFEGRMRIAGASDADIDRYHGDELRRAQERIDAFRASLTVPATASLTCLNSRGYPAGVILEQAGRVGAELIVVGKHGGSMLDERLLGSMTQNLLYHATTSVMVVP